jgi:hypothetical protein
VAQFEITCRRKKDWEKLRKVPIRKLGFRVDWARPTPRKIGWHIFLFAILCHINNSCLTYFCCHSCNHYVTSTIQLRARELELRFICRVPYTQGVSFRTQQTQQSLSTYLSIYLCVCLSICLSIYDSTSFLLDLGRFFSFFILYTVVRTPWTGDQPVARPLPTHRTTQTQTKRTQTSTPWVGFEPTIPAFERTKTVMPQIARPMWSAQSHSRVPPL